MTEILPSNIEVSPLSDEYQEKFLIFVGYFPDDKEARYCYKMADYNVGQVTISEPRWFAKPLHKGKATPGLVLKFQVKSNENGRLIVTGEGIYAGRWQNQKQVLEWQAAQKSRDAVHAQKLLQQNAQHFSEIEKQLEPIRESIKTLSTSERLGLIAWIIDYLTR